MSEATILVPGFSDNAGFLRSLELALRREQLDVCTVSPQPSNGDVPLEALAAQLADYVEANLPPAQPVNLFGFSMGGLICRAYVQMLGGLARTRRLITLATPHRGTYAAYLFNRPACLQMRPGSPFLADLNRDLSALEQLNFTSIWTPMDLTIMPAVSSVLPVGEIIPILSPFHRTLTLDPRVISTIVACLRKPVKQAMFDRF